MKDKAGTVLDKFEYLFSFKFYVFSGKLSHIISSNYLPKEVAITFSHDCSMADGSRSGNK